MFVTRLVATLVLVLAAACGDDGGRDVAADAATEDATAATPDARPDAGEAEPDAGPEPTALDRLCAPDGPVVAMFRRGMLCSSQFYIQPAHDPGVFAPERLSGLCRAQLGGYLADGTINLDDGAIDACLEWVETAPCELINVREPAPAARGTPCDGLLVGNVEVDGSCDITAQCAGDSHCLTSGLPCGQCTARLADGEPCTYAEQCSSGACRAGGTCGPPAELGDACLYDDDCRGLLDCDTDIGICTRVLPRAGIGCTSHSDCGFPLFSLYCDLADTGTCTPLPGPGQPCLHDIQGYEDLCDPLKYVWCSPVDDTCKAPTITQEGQPCSMLPTLGAGALKCDEGLACTQAGSTTDGMPDGVCYRPGEEGDSCGMATDGTDACRYSLSCEDEICQLEDAYTGMCPAPEMP